MTKVLRKHYYILPPSLRPARRTTSSHPHSIHNPPAIARKTSCLSLDKKKSNPATQTPNPRLPAGPPKHHRHHNPGPPHRKPSAASSPPAPHPPPAPAPAPPSSARTAPPSQPTTPRAPPTPSPAAPSRPRSSPPRAPKQTPSKPCSRSTSATRAARGTSVCGGARPRPAARGSATRAGSTRAIAS